MSADTTIPAGIDLAFMRKLDPTGRVPKIIPGGSHQVENAARQRCVRRGWVVYRNTGSVFRGWMLTKEGITALDAVSWTATNSPEPRPRGVSGEG